MNGSLLTTRVVGVHKHMQALICPISSCNDIFLAGNRGYICRDLLNFRLYCLECTSTLRKTLEIMGIQASVHGNRERGTGVRATEKGSFVCRVIPQIEVDHPREGSVFTTCFRN